MKGRIHPLHIMNIKRRANDKCQDTDINDDNYGAADAVVVAMKQNG